jgi:hypothetical protein
LRVSPILCLMWFSLTKCLKNAPYGIFEEFSDEAGVYRG